MFDGAKLLAYTFEKCKFTCVAKKSMYSSWLKNAFT